MRRRLKGTWHVIAILVSAILVLLDILYLTGYLATPILYLYPIQINALGLTLMFILGFLLVPATKTAPKDRVPWYDMVIALVGVVPAIYLFVVYPGRIRAPYIGGTGELILAVVLFVCLLESSRRLLGWGFTIVVIVFFLYPLLARFAPGPLSCRAFPFVTLMELMYVSDLGVFGGFLDIAFGTIFMFLVFGAFLQVTGGAKLFIDLGMTVAGGFRGGPAKVSIIASSLVGTVSGSSVANAAMVGPITIPMMKGTGYKPHFAAAVEAVAGCGGQVMPPVMGVAAFVMVNVLGISYWRLCIAAILPAILYYTALYVQVDAEAALTHLEGLPREKLPSLRRVLMKNGYLLIPLLVLIYFLGARAYSPAVACLYAVASLIVVSSFKKETRLNWKSFVTAIEDSGWFLLQLGFAMALVSILATSVIITGLGPNISVFLRDMAGGNLPILLLMAGFACYLFGTGLDTVSAYLLVALLVAPAIIQAGVSPLPAHFFVLYLAFIGHITPPVAPPVFVAAGIAGAPFFKTGWLAMRLGLGLLAVPFFAIYRPGLLFIGNPGEILYATVVSFAGIVLVSGGFGGYLLGSRNVVERIGLVVAGLLLVWPPFIADILGVALGIAILMPWRKVRTLGARLLGGSKKQAPEEVQREPQTSK